MLRIALIVLAVTLALTATAPASALASNSTAALRAGIAWHREQTWAWQDVAFRARTRSSFMERRVTGLGYLRWQARLWSQRRIAARTFAQNPPHKAEWLCIHHYEGSWTDPNSPFYGGLQMDLEFQQTYGGRLLRLKGTADHWTMLEQMWVAERAYKTRGFWPWPNTARYCGLL
jgi:hypothetical protein